MTANKVSHGRTKASSIAENVLGPASQDMLDLDSDKLYDEVGLLVEMQPQLVEENRVDLRWVDFFMKSKDRNPCTEFKKMVTFVLSSPVSTASCERVFSMREQA
ncbi:unnamed protein product [Parnassius apollo]|uniref:(apollo) hypothetical protein n=1 Tax=Parnassius apollo TaxID=110799 RepID=A0A8S3XBT1_PARAO|nr:unnamed protein product [Parnassius apollo]